MTGEAITDLVTIARVHNERRELVDGDCGEVASVIRLDSGRFTAAALLSKTDGLDLHVVGLDAVDGTPVLGIKPYLREFGPRAAVVQPEWADELTRRYYRTPAG
ncbi:TrmO family methyltransferase [Streptomyces sp. NBC_00645]|uniref:TrmO family methyltransferase domain-containing protein n=1 Tax=Streptomyces sp. NBC_00645 TaxID=2975795 RepID=UPI0032547BC6